MEGSLLGTSNRPDRGPNLVDCRLWSRPIQSADRAGRNSHRGEALWMGRPPPLGTQASGEGNTQRRPPPPFGSYSSRCSSARQLAEMTSIDIHDEYVARLSDLTLERDPGPIRRPRRIRITAGIAGEPNDASPVRIHHIDLVITRPVGDEGDLLSVRGPH